jgi:Mpv17 / PMP22 family
LLQGQPDLIQAKLKQDLKPTVIRNWQIWVPFQFLNFRFVPQTLQVGILWQTIPICGRNFDASALLEAQPSSSTASTAEMLLDLLNPRSRFEICFKTCLAVIEHHQCCQR